MSLLTRALHFAVDAHGESVRKGDGSPMILHAMEAAAITATLTREEEVIAAAALHDTIEDAGVTPEEIRARFGPRVAELVLAETEDKRRDVPPGESWRVRKEETIARLRASRDPQVGMVFLGDKLANMRAFYRSKQSEGRAMWLHFNQKDPEQHHWYYRSIADALGDLKDTPAWREYDELIRRVFDENEGGAKNECKL